jgi:hypothetical protein
VSRALTAANQAAKSRVRMSSRICRKAGSGARHMVRYVSRKGSQIKTKGSAQLEMPTVLKITIWRQFWQHPANSECVAPPPARSFQISARTNTGPADRRTTCKRKTRLFAPIATGRVGASSCARFGSTRRSKHRPPVVAATALVVCPGRGPYLSSRRGQRRFGVHAGLEGGMWPVLSPGAAAGHSAGSDSL